MGNIISYSQFKKSYNKQTFEVGSRINLPLPTSFVYYSKGLI